MAKKVHPHKVRWKKDAPGFSQNYNLSQIRGLTVEQIARMDVPQLAGVLRSAQREFNRKVTALQKTDLYSHALDRFYDNIYAKSFGDKDSAKETREEKRLANMATGDLIQNYRDDVISDWNAPFRGTHEKDKFYRESLNIIYNRRTHEYETSGDYLRFAKQKMTWDLFQYQQFLKSETATKTGILKNMAEMQKNLGLEDIGRKLTQTELSFIWALVDEFRHNPMGNMYDFYAIRNSNVLIEMFQDKNNRPRTFNEALAYMQARAIGVNRVESWQTFTSGEVGRNAKKRETMRRIEADDGDGEDSEYAGNELGNKFPI